MTEDACGFRFDKETHTYWLGETRLLGVSEIIAAAGLKSFDGISEATLERARQRGIAVHAACQYMDDGDLNRASVSTEIEPYVRAWERFKADMGNGFEITENEKPAYNIERGIAGTPDKVFRLNRGFGILDIKTYQPDAVTGVQLGGYREVRFPGEIIKRWGLWLKANGKYSLTEFDSHTDSMIFNAALAIAQFKRSAR